MKKLIVTCLLTIASITLLQSSSCYVTADPAACATAGAGCDFPITGCPTGNNTTVTAAGSKNQVTTASSGAKGTTKSNCTFTCSGTDCNGKAVSRSPAIADASEV